MDGGLRRRGRPASSSDADGPPRLLSTLQTKFHNLDMYPKLEEDYRSSTSTGGAVSAIGLFIIVVLFLSEMSTYLSPEKVHHVMVDHGIGEKLRINFNVTFYALNCAECNLDSMDVAGDQQNDVDHHILKERLASDGTIIGNAFAHRMDEEAEAEPQDANYCGSCYGAAEVEGTCCNTCDDVRDAYNKKGWNTIHLDRTAEQCVREKRHPASSARKGEGCRISGYLLVNKVAGNFHVALGESKTRDMRHIHQFNPSTMNQYNVSHRVNELSFGKPFPGSVNPLDGRTHVVTHGYGVYQYYIKVVPTVYQDDWNFIESNQYSVTDQWQAAEVNGVRQNVLPGVFFVYSLSPFMVRVSQVSVSFLQFVTGVCAIVGGVFAVTGIVDSCLHRTMGKKIA